MAGNPQLLAVIRNEIELRGSISFARFMELALYHPQFGYYMSGQVRVGKEGDYFTSPTVGPVFGRFLGMQFAEMWETMGKPKPFVLLELGSNRGWLAEDVMCWARERRPDFAEAIDYRVCERGKRSVVSGQWSAFSDWREIPDGAVTGCIFSNELVDAFPVHLVRRVNGDWKELYVDWREEAFQWTVGALGFPMESLPMTLREFPFPDGYTTEVHLAAVDWLSHMARILSRGFLMTVDYGYLDAKYYAPYRSNGTLLCYHKHQTNTEPLERVGEQDITAHVNFGALVLMGTALGLDFTGLTDQTRFIMGIGQSEIERIVNAKPGQPDTTRQQLQTLLNPADMGRTFKVLVQQKGIEGVETKQP